MANELRPRPRATGDDDYSAALTVFVKRVAARGNGCGGRGRDPVDAEISAVLDAAGGRLLMSQMGAKLSDVTKGVMTKGLMAYLAARPDRYRLSALKQGADCVELVDVKG